MLIYWSTLHLTVISLKLPSIVFNSSTNLTNLARIVCEQVVYCYRVLLQLSVHSSDLTLKLVLYCYPVTSRCLSACLLAHPTHPTQPNPDPDIEAERKARCCKRENTICRKKSIGSEVTTILGNVSRMQYAIMCEKHTDIFHLQSETCAKLSWGAIAMQFPNQWGQQHRLSCSWCYFKLRRLTCATSTLKLHFKVGNI